MSRPSLTQFLVALFALGGIATTAAIGVDTVAHAEEAAQSGTQMPGFALRDMNGQEFSNEQLKGKISLVNFWATWCQPCMVEMRHLNQFHKDYGERGFQVVSVSIDDARSSSMVKPIVKRNGYLFNVLLDKETSLVGKVNPAKTLPYNMLVDGMTDPENLQVTWTHLGYTPGDEAEMKTIIENALTAAGK